MKTAIFFGILLCLVFVEGQFWSREKRSPTDEDNDNGDIGEDGEDIDSDDYDFEANGEGKTGEGISRQGRPDRPNRNKNRNVRRKKPSPCGGRRNIEECTCKDGKTYATIKKLMKNCRRNNPLESCSCADGSTWEPVPVKEMPCRSRRNIEECTCKDGETYATIKDLKENWRIENPLESCSCKDGTTWEAEPVQGLTLTNANITDVMTGTVEEEVQFTGSTQIGVAAIGDKKNRDFGATIIAGGTITGAIIGQVGALSGGSSGSGPKGGCSWQGTSWFFFGCGRATCPAHHGYELEKTFSGNMIREHTINGRDFGVGCLYGEKALCCRSKKDDNNWDGQWEAVQNNQHYRCAVYYAENSGCKRSLECVNNNPRYGITIRGTMVNYPRCNQVELPYGGSYILMEGRYGKITFPRYKRADGSYMNEIWYKV